MIGQKIQDWRRQRGWPQSRFATELGKTQGYISQLEAGKIPKDINSLRKISKLTGLSVDELSPEVVQ